MTAHFLRAARESRIATEIRKWRMQKRRIKMDCIIYLFADDTNNLGMMWSLSMEESEKTFNANEVNQNKVR